MKITRTARLATAARRREGHARTDWDARASVGWPAPGWFVVLGIYLLVYISWLIWGWIPFGEGLVGEVILLPINPPQVATNDQPGELRPAINQ